VGVNLLDAVKDDFSSKTRRAGDQYYRDRAVTLRDCGPAHVRSRVRGSFLYDVEIKWDSESFDCRCTCPFFLDRDENCKHIWATLLAAQAAGKLPKEYWTIDSEDFPDDFDSASDPGFATAQLMFGQRTALLRAAREAQSAAQPKRHTVWKRRLHELRAVSMYRPRAIPEPWPVGRQIFYLINVPASAQEDALCIDLATRPSGSQPGKTAPLKKIKMRYSQVAGLPDEMDRQMIRMLAGVTRGDIHRIYDYGDPEIRPRFVVEAGNANDLARLMCQSGRCLLQTSPQQKDPPTIAWDDGEPWRPYLALVPNDTASTYRLEGGLRRGEQRMKFSEAQVLLPGGPVIASGCASALQDDGALDVVRSLSDEPIDVPVEQVDTLIAELTHFPLLPALDLPASLGVDQVRVAPRPRLRIKAPSTKSSAWVYGDNRLQCTLCFGYDAHIVDCEDAASVIFAAEQRQLVHRDHPAERAAITRLRELGVRQTPTYQSEPGEFRIAPRHLAAAVRALTAEQWHVEVDGKAYRQPGQIRIEVSSGIDWFEVKGEADFEGVSVSLPALLRALKKRQDTIVLDDGTIGILPEQWLKRYGLLAAVGDCGGESAVQFGKSQAGLLDVLLADLDQVSFDQQFAQAREQLRRFEGIAPADAPSGFVGTLRPYQRDGLGWLNFLAEFGINGCLADDMGLGKTIQVLALLEQRRQQKKGPSLVVVPRSLVFNWHQEAARFTPQLRVLDHATADRRKTLEHFQDYDLILTTYGTLRNDVTVMREMQFDYVILDEAQAIKNAGSESAKAARLLRARHRLALSGTPVQNHLGELWSLLEFLNPGMMGGSSALSALTGGTSRVIDPQTQQFLARALRPFLLRRTKEQVARDLPPKLEQTLFCELDAKQRKLYDQLKDHYRQSLLTRVAEQGLNKSKLQILEALLRLRQAACHPGLLDKSRIGEGSAKLDTLLPRLAEVADEGHKTIVFSQFTSLLAIVRKKLDEKETVYEYLDGKTRDRQERVNRFQTDPECKLFLVSLKAGGLGLNLTAAQYVFLLDPWWNPAIEAQAIDRAHRIGQTQKVFAYRLIAKDTVEEKVLQLQQTKRELADAIINADNALISKLGKDELELLLS
jgi:hypothetical protein